MTNLRVIVIDDEFWNEWRKAKNKVVQQMKQMPDIATPMSTHPITAANAIDYFSDLMGFKE